MKTSKRELAEKRVLETQSYKKEYSVAKHKKPLYNGTVSQVIEMIKDETEMWQDSSHSYDSLVVEMRLDLHYSNGKEVYRQAREIMESPLYKAMNEKEAKGI